MTGKTVVVDFVAKGTTSDEWRMVLVESGPWSGPVSDHLKTLQNRLYDCIDAALDGQLAEKFPESKGKRLVVQVDCYNIARDPVESFFDEFSKRVFAVGDYKDATANNPYVSGIVFAITFDSIH
jgi:hypothetical protein